MHSYIVIVVGLNIIPYQMLESTSTSKSSLNASWEYPMLAVLITVSALICT